MLTVLGLLACGIIAGRTGALPTGTDKVLDRLVITLALPGLVLAKVPDLVLDARTLVPIGVAWSQLVVLVLVVLLLSRLMGWTRRTTGTLLLCVPLGNTSFLGFPAIEALLGADHLPHAIVYDQLGSFLALATWGSFVAARYGSGAAPTLAGIVRRVVTFPAFVALVVALASRVVGLPPAVDAIAEALGATLTPLTMLAIGLRLRVPDRARAGLLATGLGLRMVAAPAAVLGVAALLGASGQAWEAATLEAAMPPMVTAGVVASAAGLDERLATALTGGGILVAMVTLPIIAAYMT
jgi:predicted permease